jgi:two-component system response regulator (stage 0 sporulation protein A)
MKILIADSSEEFCSALSDILEKTHQVHTVSEGFDALHLLQSFRPDVLVLDMMLPGLDGITLLQRAHAQNIHPAILAIVCYSSDYVVNACSRLSVDYIMMKPCDIDAAVARINDLAQSSAVPAAPLPDARTLISNILLQLGIGSKLRGYAYLREAILQMRKDPSQAITKEIYPAAISITPGATTVQAERSIRTAILSAWRKRDDAAWQLYFPTDDSGKVPRPTNAAFICRLADYLNLHADKLPPE